MLYKEEKTKIEVIFNCGKLIQLHTKGEVNDIYFKDSNNLLGMPLRDFNKNLSLGLNMNKEI